MFDEYGNPIGPQLNLPGVGALPATDIGGFTMAPIAGIGPSPIPLPGAPDDMAFMPSFVPDSRAMNVDPLGSIGVSQIANPAGAYAVPGSVGYTDVPGEMSQIGPSQIPGGAGPNEGGLVTGGPSAGPATDPAVKAAAAAQPETREGLGAQGIASAATGIGQIAGGIMNITQGARALKNVDIAGAEAGVDAAYATRPGLSTPAEFYDMQKEAYDQRLLAMRTEDINRGLATNVAASQQYGARGLGANLAAAAQAQRAQQQEVLNQQRLQTQALSSLAQAREREIQRREQRATFDIGIAYDELKAEQAREAYARQQIAQGIVGTTTGLARTALTFGAEQGAKVTPGEFSHDTNPIDIVQDGAKIGEMTGGEYIFNPTQAKKMMKEANSGNSELHKFVRKTLNRFHKDAAKHEGK
jgi:hypothetical protein